MIQVGQTYRYTDGSGYHDVVFVVVEEGMGSPRPLGGQNVSGYFAIILDGALNGGWPKKSGDIFFFTKGSHISSNIVRFPEER